MIPSLCRAAPLLFLAAFVGCDKQDNSSSSPAPAAPSAPASAPVPPPPPAASAKSFLCPMDCEHGKTYPTKGKCPVCEMDLEESVEGKFAHSDHRPKHGGQFIMASDNWHHVEGTLPEPRQFVAWFYNNFSKPLEVGKTVATLAVMTKVRAKGRRAEYVDLVLAPSPVPTTAVTVVADSAPAPQAAVWPQSAAALPSFR